MPKLAPETPCTPVRVTLLPTLGAVPGAVPAGVRAGGPEAAAPAAPVASTPPPSRRGSAVERVARSIVHAAGFLVVAVLSLVIAPLAPIGVCVAILAIPTLFWTTLLRGTGDMVRWLARRPDAGAYTACDYAAGFALMAVAQMLVLPQSQSPIMLDLDGDGAIATTASSTARNALAPRVERMVRFDLAGTGTPQTLAWSAGRGDAFLVDDRDGGATRAAAGDGVIDGRRLFGDEGGRWASGYDKLATLDADHDGALVGAELAGLAAWSDDGDAIVEPGELVPVGEAGITAIGVRHHAERNARGEALDRGVFTQRGVRKLSEDVWFPAR